MDRQAALLTLARSLGSAADAADWSALALASRKLGNDLPLLAKQGPWKDNERKALMILRDVHDKAHQRCSDAKGKLATHLSDIQANREGWIAYALNGGINSDGKQA
jgi:hypothetical protein